MKLSVFDVRVAGVIVTLWTVTVFVLVASFGFENSKFFRFGPGESVHFFGNPVDTTAKYCGILFYVAVQQLVQTYGLNTITPWLLTQVQNVQVKSLDQKDSTVMTITNFWYIFLWSGRIISIQILLSQIDFLLLILFMELVMTSIATDFYLRKKRAFQESLLHGDTSSFAFATASDSAATAAADIERGNALKTSIQDDVCDNEQETFPDNAPWRFSPPSSAGSNLFAVPSSATPHHLTLASSSSSPSPSPSSFVSSSGNASGNASVSASHHVSTSRPPVVYPPRHFPQNRFNS